MSQFLNKFTLLIPQFRNQHLCFGQGLHFSFTQHLERPLNELCLANMYQLITHNFQGQLVNFQELSCRYTYFTTFRQNFHLSNRTRLQTSELPNTALFFGIRRMTPRELSSRVPIACPNVRSYGISNTSRQTLLGALEFVITDGVTSHRYSRRYALLIS